ncbi:hypothetical protein KO525_04455 [Psychrosphaera sp. B3R10]|uniref:FlgO family outer membrane protein n=1 Tax=unclassified Psychrosphaera TaxID=2641570 RepID=UPI001C07F919|nr:MULTISPECIES: FlgO family outer membrane protein [unclassified Psychrosphaera]MBU2883171.1 hypothetical protein [Psychrosphaera sp. I2R16]MBU2988627.1 hypothetical protein [Psychrosphaera sp. B3R10]
MTFFTELKRRNVFKVASVYLVTCWIILQIVAVISPALHLPILFSTITTVILTIAFPFVCIFAWAFELTPEGLKRTNEVDIDESIGEQTGNKINYLLAGALVLALAFIAYEKLFTSNADVSLERSIAVLPFEDMSPDKSQGYFGDGIAEEILNSLARLNQLVVIARTSSFNFKDSNTDIREIGQKLNVNYVLEGSVRKDRDKVRITAQLIEVTSGAHIWSQTYDRELTSIFALQDELTFAITQALKLNLLPEQVEHEAGMTTNPQAYELFIQGRELAYQRSSESLKQAADILQQAIKLDEQFYLAKAQLYMVYSFADNYGGFIESLRQAEKERLFWELMIAPDFPLKTLVIATQASDSGNLAISVKLYKQAYEKAPNDPLIQNVSTLALDNILDGIKRREKILKTNPQSQINITNLVFLYLVTEQPDKAQAMLSTMEKLFPENTQNFLPNIYYSYAYQQDIEATLALINDYRSEPSADYRRAKSAINILAGNIDTALDYIDEELSQSPEYAEQFINALLLLLDLDTRGKLNEQQQQRYQQLPISESTQTELLVFYKLLLGDETLYEQQQQLTGLSAEEFIQRVDLNQTEPYDYAAIKKRKGDDSYVQVLKTSLAYSSSQCQQTQNKVGWFCAGIMDFIGDISEQQTQNMFKRQPMLDTYLIGIEKFILTAPVYYGLSQHPEFEPLANAFLDRTFRKWNPDLVAEKVTASPTK